MAQVLFARRWTHWRLAGRSGSGKPGRTPASLQQAPHFVHGKLMNGLAWRQELALDELAQLASQPALVEVAEEAAHALEPAQDELCDASQLLVGEPDCVGLAGNEVNEAHLRAPVWRGDWVDRLEIVLVPLPVVAFYTLQVKTSAVHRSYFTSHV